VPQVAKCGHYTVCTWNEHKHIYTHTSHEHITIGYDDIYHEECVNIILSGILCCFMSFCVVRFKFVYSPPEDECIHSKSVEALK
jgi:hypothetical protein